MIIPSRKQYQKWSLPSKWTFWAGLIAMVSLSLSVFGFFPSGDRNSEKELNNLVLQVAQELRYNAEWLSALAVSNEGQLEIIPVGRVKSTALTNLIFREFDKVVEHSYGEEKYIYQRIIKISDLGETLGSPDERSF